MSLSGQKPIEPKKCNQTQTLSSEMDHDNDKNELEKLGAEVNQMGHRILKYRTTLPDQLKNTLVSTLSAQRPLLSTHFNDGSEPGPSGNPNPDAGGPIESGKGPPLAEEDQETAEKTRLLRQKISSNFSAMPALLKRMKECISRIENLESCNGFVHPAFRRKRTT
ncbi:unnamed protein product [Camellia sinensis]